MKIFQYNLASSNRHGLSVIEVLTSIVVALIGVFGVLAMIPFSVKQTQSGLDQDAATSMARNAVSSFEAVGFKATNNFNQLNWVASDGSAAPTPVFTAATNPLFCIDPLGVTERIPGTNTFGTFPFNCSFFDGTPVPAELSMPTVNLLRPDGNQFDSADARRMFRLTDDLVFAKSDAEPTAINPDPELSGPQQLFNEGPNGLLNRQSTGAVSWCAIAQPIVNDPDSDEVDSFKFYVLVFKDRTTDITFPESVMNAAVVTDPTMPAKPLSNVTISAPLPEDLRRNDWVMLINREPGPEPVAFRTNITFARVSNLYGEDPEAPGYDPLNTVSRITLDGPDFNFTNAAPTYIVQLRDVVAVFPRTIKIEKNSLWTTN